MVKPHGWKTKEKEHTSHVERLQERALDLRAGTLL